MTSVGCDSATVVATVAGTPYTTVPDDLFIPPDALEVLLDSFSGPLDLLLYLIRKQNIDIMDIPIVTITRQYVEYISIMEQRRLGLAADYLVMAAVLAEIKSRLLLPQMIGANDADELEVDPRMALVRRLQVYEQFKHAAEQLGSLTQCERDVFRVSVSTALLTFEKPLPEIELQALVDAMQSIVVQQGHTVNHSIQRELLSVRERMASVLALVREHHHVELNQLFLPQEGRMGLVVSLLAILELAKQSLLTITQTDTYAPIYIRSTQQDGNL